ncbi:hypothetical protein BYT27DRAFT_7198250 [Phlegmacium glaucopus]|nr:hypothetical protein BYT27DRAFT_7198250 [Phlegmacium glaucopus]
MPVAMPRTPFPSFTLALSRQSAGDNASDINMQQRNTSNVLAEPPIDLMKTFDTRYGSSCKMRDEEDRSDTETVFEERTHTVAVSKGSIKGSKRRNACKRNNLFLIFRMLACFTGGGRGSGLNENG